MIEELKNYKFIKKSTYELEVDKLVDGITRKMWDDNGYSALYCLGSLNQLKALAEWLRKNDTLELDQILAVINTYKTSSDTPNEIKNLVDIILDEFDYKE